MTDDHFRADFDRYFRRLLADAVVVEVSAAIMENFGRLPAALAATLVAELLLHGLLRAPVGSDTGAAVIEKCERLPAALLGTAGGELLLHGLLHAPVGSDTGGAVIQNCEIPYKLLVILITETCSDQITTARSRCPCKATGPVSSENVF
jgi:hypothetical protein